MVTVFYCTAIIINFFSPGSILFQGNVELSSFSLPSGEVFHLVNGAANPLRFVGDIGWLTLVVYTAAAFVNLARRGNARKAVIFGGAIFLCLGLGYLHGTLIDLKIADPPYLGSFLFLPLTLLMSYSLAGEVLLASHLTLEIEKAEERWRNLLMKVHLIVLGIDHKRTIFFVNPYFLQLTGYDEKEVINQQFSTIVPEERRAEITDRLEMVIKGKAPIKVERSFPVVTKGGEQRTIIWSSVLIEDKNETAPRILSIGKDVTDQKKAEKSRDVAIEELEAFKIKLEQENISLKQMIQADHGFTEIIGESDGLLYVLTKIQQVAKTDATVLIVGETGTGKELVARAIHRESNRCDKPFIRLNCSAIPAGLVESELFGHEQGAFTNAVSLRRGKFELAEGGTIFLDEISEMPIDTQAKLLSVLQEKEFERVGGSETIQTDVRVISATNRDLEGEITEGRFRTDLFYRLNVYPISIPPLRDRKNDIPLLLKHFVSTFNKEFGRNIVEIPASMIEHLTGYDWPGNIRELRNMIERAVITSNSSNLQFPEDLMTQQKNKQSLPDSMPEIAPLAEVERQHILRALNRTNWQISGVNGAASILQMNPSTLRSRIKKLELKQG
jgi:PAS domain S-box-containing protein